MHTTIDSRRTNRWPRLVVSLGATMLCALAFARPLSVPSIDGTYELTKRVMSDGTVLNSPAISGLYTLRRGRFHLTLFFRTADGTIASEATNGRYTFDSVKYCEWIDYTIRKDLDKPGVTTEPPTVPDHCALVTSRKGRFDFSPPGEGVETSFGTDGFTAKLGNEFVDHWRRVK